MQFRETTETTDYVTRSSMLIECDYLEECEATPEQTKIAKLIRLCQNETCTDEQSKEVAILREELGVKAERTEYFENVTIGLYGRASRRNERITLRKPFGHKHTEIEMTISGYEIEQTGKLWDDNPIEHAIILISSPIPLATLRSNRLERTHTVTLWGLHRAKFSEVVSMLLAIGPYMVGTRVLNLPGLDATNLLQTLKRRWPVLHTITTTSKRS